MSPLLLKKSDRSLPFASASEAFSVIELLVSIGIVTVLSSMGFFAYKSGVDRSRSVQCVANLRQIGVGIAGYTVEHKGRLPGPLLPSQGPRYNRVNGEVAAYLASYIAPYIGIPEAAPGPLQSIDIAKVQAPMFYCPAFAKVARNNFTNAYFMRWRIVEMGTAMPPWGNYGTSTPQTPKAIYEIPNPSSTWAICDVDQQCPFLPAEGWVANSPSTPVHGKSRNALFFDWHVGPIAVDGSPL